MARPARFADHRYLGDKRSQVVYDLDLAAGDPEVAAAIEGLVASEAFAAFAPDTLAEARNRGYRPHRSVRAALAARQAHPDEDARDGEEESDAGRSLTGS